MGGPLTRSRLLAGSVLVATFVAGAMVGGAALRLFARDDVPATMRAGEPRPEGRRERRPSIFDELELSAAQRARIDSIVEQRRVQTAQFWEQHGPQMRAIVDSTRAEIDRVLTAEQRTRMEDWRAKRRKQHEEWQKREGRDTAARARPPVSFDEWPWPDHPHRRPAPISMAAPR
ncbi:MAG TPA: hypothetical protein VK939_09845 [Longimicrobiales bacterium]|nr:hypothetical protein [Longimicrobiales bacterium]